LEIHQAVLFWKNDIQELKIQFQISNYNTDQNTDIALFFDIALIQRLLNRMEDAKSVIYKEFG